jgi:hypothetical protein
MGDLPSGTVTFLFTDIEGSTALWERDRAAMAAAVARPVLVRKDISEQDGVLLKVVVLPFTRASRGPPKQRRSPRCTERKPGGNP